MAQMPPSPSHHRCANTHMHSHPHTHPQFPPWYLLLDVSCPSFALSLVFALHFLNSTDCIFFILYITVWNISSYMFLPYAAKNATFFDGGFAYLFISVCPIVPSIVHARAKFWSWLWFLGLKTLLSLTWHQIMLMGRLIGASNGCSHLLVIRGFGIDRI